MKVHVEIGGARRGARVPFEGAPHVEADGPCPSCGGPKEGPLKIMGDVKRQVVEHATISAPAFALCCRSEIGKVVATFSTIFGLEEDLRVLNGRARVY